MASRKRTKLEGGAVETVKSVHDVLEVVQTAMLAQVRRGGAPLGPNEIAAVIRKLWVEAEKGDHGLAPEQSFDASKARSLQDSKGDIQQTVAKLRVEATGGSSQTEVSSQAVVPSSAGLPLTGLSWILVAPFADLMSGESEISPDNLPWSMVPAFEAVMTMLCGEETLEKCRVKAEPMCEELEQSGLDAGQLRERVASDARANKIFAYLLSKLVMRFEKFERRREWMVRTLNDELDDAELPLIQGTENEWEFSESCFNKVFRRYAVEEASNTQNAIMDRAYELIWKQHDAKGISVAAKFLKGLEAQRKSRS